HARAVGAYDQAAAVLQRERIATEGVAGAVAGGAQVEAVHHVVRAGVRREAVAPAGAVGEAGLAPGVAGGELHRAAPSSGRDRQGRVGGGDAAGAVGDHDAVERTVVSGAGRGGRVVRAGRPGDIAPVLLPLIRRGRAPG